MGFARFQNKPAATSPMAEINVTPLVDVMLVLLVIFMLAAPVMNTAIRLQLPQTAANAAPDSAPEIIKLSIDAQSRVYWQEQLVSEPELSQELQKLQASKKNAQLQLYIDRSVPYEIIARLMAQAQSHGQQQLIFMTETMAQSKQ